MGGSGGGGGSRGSRAPKILGGPPSATAGEILDDEITQDLAEAKRVVELLETLKNARDGDLVVCALNAGQGDCCVMRLPDGEIVVVDCNVKSANVNVVGFLEKAGVKTIDLLILTHPDQDHVSGLSGLANGVKIKNVIDGRFRKEGDEGERTPGYEDYRRTIDELKASGTKFFPRSAIRGDEVDIGPVRISFLAPQRTMQAADANEASLCFRVQYGQRSMLFGGDVTKEMWATIQAKEGARLKSEVFWSSHHGAESGCHPDAVKAISPKLTVISVGENNYGHPHPEALSCYRNHSSIVRRTDEGSIGIVSPEGGAWRKIV